MPLAYCVNPKCKKVLRKKGAFCSMTCQAQVDKQERKAKREARRPGRPKNDE